MGTVTRTLASVIYDKLPAASNEESVTCLEKAIRINPNRLMHYIELGKTYAQMGRNSEAKRCLEKGLSMPCVDKDDPTLKEVARQTLASLR
jgi:tetratricopeptide (TPR) repeat protein